MSAHEHGSVSPNGGPGYETRDADIRALIQFAFGLAIVLLVTIVAMRFTFAYLNRLTPLGQTASPFQNVRQVPTGPLLQATPHKDLDSYCAGQVDAENSYSWVNKAGGIVQIPVDRAMDLVLQRGLPSRSAADMTAGGGVIAPVGAAGEPQANYLQGPCGYLAPGEPAKQ